MTPERCKQLPSDCWEKILTHLPNQTHFSQISLLSKQFLHLTNRLRVKLSITDALIFSNPQIQTLINKRFPNLKTLDFSNFNGNIDLLLLGISNSCEFRNLVEIDLSNSNRVPIKGLEKLGVRVRVRVLRCCRIRVLRDGDLVGIANSMRFLEELDLSYPRSELDLSQGGSGGATLMTVTDFGVRVLSMNVRGLRRVCLSGNHFVTNKALVCLSENCVFLEGVDVVDCTLITAKGVLFLLRNSVRLSSISVSGIEFGDGGLGFEDLSCTGLRLKSLELHHSSISDEFMSVLVEACVDLKRLKLVQCRNFSVSSFALLVGRCQLEHLTLLNIDWIFYESMKLTPYVRNLVSLQLWDSSMSGNTFYMMANICPSVEVVRLDCSCCGITDSLLVSVKYTNIRSLNLSTSTFENKCLRRIAFVCPNIEILNISNCPKITEECICEILDICREIRHLSIAGCKINSIGKGLELPKLEVLYAANSAMNDEGLARIAIRCPGVVKLDLAGCTQVTDRGVKLVVGACQILREISLAGCSNVDVSIADWMLCTRKSLVKIVPPTYTPITDRQKRFYLRHGCQIEVGSIGSRPKFRRF